MKILTYQDANALYSWAMSQLLPMKNFKWISPNQVDILNVPIDSRIGYILEVDLDYPEELHDKHNDYPVAPEHDRGHNVTIPTIRGSVRKLVPNLNQKEKYVIHYRNLQLYVSLGLRIKKVHSVIQFEQSCWMKPYIDLYIEKRKEAIRKGDKVGKYRYRFLSLRSDRS